MPLNYPCTMRIYTTIVLLFLTTHALVAQTPGEKTSSGNPIFSGWYADPEGVIIGNRYWIYPTYSAKYGEQVFLDAFSSPDLVNWTKSARILDTSRVAWARRAIHA